MNLVKWAVFFSALFGIGWFVSFQYDPYRVCVDHPEADKKEDFYLCEPFGFTMQKGTRLERPADDRFIWEKRGDVIIGTEEPQKRRRKNPDSQKAMEEWECNQSFYLLTPDQLKNIKIEDYCSNRAKKTSPPNNKNNSNQNIVPNSAQEEL